MPNFQTWKAGAFELAVRLSRLFWRSFLLPFVRLLRLVDGLDSVNAIPITIKHLSSIQHAIPQRPRRNLSITTRCLGGAAASMSCSDSPVSIKNSLRIQEYSPTRPGSRSTPCAGRNPGPPPGNPGVPFHRNFRATRTSRKNKAFSSWIA